MYIDAPQEVLRGQLRLTVATRICCNDHKLTELCLYSPQTFQVGGKKYEQSLENYSDCLRTD